MRLMDGTPRPGKRTYRKRSDPNLRPCIGIKSRVEFDIPRLWTAEWLRQIELIDEPKRAAAAKRYVKSGHVIEINVSPGLIEAKVQGRHKMPYRVRMCSPVPAADQMSAIMRGLSERAIYGALLLSGELPPAIKEIFSRSGVSFLPEDFGRYKRLCSCPEQADDCKHILAVILVSAGEFDRDPFLMLRNRGIDKDKLISCLTAPRGSMPGARNGAECMEQERTPTASRGERAPDTPCPAEDPEIGEPLPADETFYGTQRLCEEQASPQDEVLEPDDLSGGAPAFFDFPLWRGDASFKEAIYPYYKSVKDFLGKGR